MIYVVPCIMLLELNLYQSYVLILFLRSLGWWYQVNTMTMGKGRRGYIKEGGNFSDWSHFWGTFTHQLMGVGLRTDILSVHPSHQAKMVTYSVDLYTDQQLVTSFQEVCDKARLNLWITPRAGDRLNTVPTKALGIHIWPLELYNPIQYHMGLLVFQMNSPYIAYGKHNNHLEDHIMGSLSRRRDWITTTNYGMPSTMLSSKPYPLIIFYSWYLATAFETKLSK